MVVLLDLVDFQQIADVGDIIAGFPAGLKLYGFRGARNPISEAARRVKLQRRPTRNGARYGLAA
jgi:hypothetical protein